MSAAQEPHAQRHGVGPYKGLEHYEEADWRLFYGRARECDVIVANLRARRMTVIYGQSGVGKSSLLRAGVVHRLREDARRNVDEVGVPEYVPVIVSDWRDDPVATLLSELHRAVAEFADPLPHAPARPAEAIDVLARAVDSRIVIVLDQLEEYFLYHGDEPKEEGRLVVELTRALTRERLRASFLLSIREDALAKLDRFRRDVPGLFDTILHLAALDRASAREAIVQPLARWEGPGPTAAEDELVSALLDQLAAGAPVPEQAGQGRIGRDGGAAPAAGIDPSYLQLVLRPLWESEDDPHVLRLATLERLGGTEAIARRHLDEALDALPPEERDAAAEALRFLVTPLGTKIALAPAELASFAGRDLATTVELLAGGGIRILRTVPPPPGKDGPTRYEIFHDVLGPGILDWRTRYVRDREQERERAERHELELRERDAQQQAREERRRARVFRTLALVALAGLEIGRASCRERV